MKGVLPTGTEETRYGSKPLADQAAESKNTDDVDTGGGKNLCEKRPGHGEEASADEDKARRRRDRKLTERAMAYEQALGRYKLAIFKLQQGGQGAASGEHPRKPRLKHFALPQGADHNCAKGAESEGKSGLRPLRIQAQRFQRDAKEKEKEQVI